MDGFRRRVRVGKRFIFCRANSSARQNERYTLVCRSFFIYGEEDSKRRERSGKGTLYTDDFTGNPKKIDDGVSSVSFGQYGYGLA